MNNFYSYIQIYPLLLSFIFVSYCNGQDKTSPQQSNPVISNAIAKDSVEAQAFTDPLFFIDGQLCQHLRKIFQDSKGNLWFGTNNYNIMRYDGNTLKYFTKADGLDNGRITGIVEDNEGNVWFGTYKGLTKFDGKSFTTYTEKDGLKNNEIWSLIIDSKGIFWIGHNTGISRFDGKKFSSFSIPKAKVKEENKIYSPNRVVSIVEDKDGNLWFGTDGFGICKYDPSASPRPGGEAFTNFTTENGLCDNTIYELMVDSEGNLWIGTYYGGVCRYDGEKFTNFTNDGVINGVEVSGFFEDNNGEIWFAAENFGVYRYDGTTFTNYYTNEGLITNGILSIYKDKENRFWFGGWGGLFRFDGKSFSSVSKNGPWDE